MIDTLPVNIYLATKSYSFLLSRIYFSVIFIPPKNSVGLLYIEEPFRFLFWIDYCGDRFVGDGI